jgi:hypothetical protein
MAGYGIVLAWVLSGPAIAAISVEVIDVWGAPLTPENIQQINEGLNISIRLVIGIVLALEVLDLGKQLYTLLRPRLPEPVAII